ncbi:Hypothetical predicted protein [Podarcis lilfordi]|uniref:Uncharacterized protein n=1 Tax=Podarcis lilfordi TaxID=74358 RepID=A0AA35PA39_9SAUR|nr:Hypothetical predicted protein [Podarcis lilfordi]
MAPLTCSFGGPSLSPSPLLLLLLFLSLSRVRATTPTAPTAAPTIKPRNTTLTPGGPKPPTTEDGGEGAVDPGPGPGPETTLPPDDIESDNTAIIVGCILAVLVVLALLAVFWKYRSSVKTGEPEAPAGPAEFDASELEPKGSNLE